jgi:thioredoxin 1
MSKLIKEILENDFDQETSMGNVLVDFFADWCGPCRKQVPILEQVANEIKTVKFLKVNIDAAQKTGARLNITSIPTLVLFQEGKEIDRITGLVDSDDLKNFLKKVQ